jgi:membrane dipeptidase
VADGEVHVTTRSGGLAPWGPGGAPDAGLLAEARALLREAEIVDLHVDTFIAIRLFGWDVHRRHGSSPFFGRLFGHLDLPRLAENGVGGAMWSITTNPFRRAPSRWQTFLRNLDRLEGIVAASASRMVIARDLAEYRAARARGAHVVLPAIQGGHAIEAAPALAASIPRRLITRVTLVHLLSSAFGSTSVPLSRLERRPGLTRLGEQVIESLDAERVLVDLAHIHPAAFWRAVDVHDRARPLVSTHTGVSGVRPHWRNLDDAQLRAIAESGGTVGIIFEASFLRRRGGPRDADMVVEHLEHTLRVIGEDHVSIGSDFDGFIVPPRGLRSGDDYPALVARLLRRGHGERTIKKLLGGNALRVLGAIRPGNPPALPP